MANMKRILTSCLAFVATAAIADTFRVTPYLQRPATNAISVLWFTETGSQATIRWWLEAGGSTQSAVTSPEQAVELQYCDRDRSEYNTRTSYSGIERGPIQSIPWQHRARLEGLSSGTRYVYAVELSGGTVYTNRFRTAPGRDSPVRFICYSDSETEPESTGKRETADIPSGSARTDKSYPVDQTVGYARNIIRMKERSPDFYVIAGDLVQYGEEQRDWDEFWRHNAGCRNDPGGSAPILAAPGNHDYVGKDINDRQYNAYDGGEAAIQRYLRYFEFEPNGVDFADGGKDRSELFHRLDFGRATVIFLDANNGDDSDMTRDTCLRLYRDASCLPTGHEPPSTQAPCRAPDFNPGSPQFTWFTNQLADAQAKGQFTFVVCHHMPYSVGYHNRTNVWTGTKNTYDEPYSARPVRVLTPYMLQYGVTAWIAGHDEIMEHSRVTGFERRPNGRLRETTLEIYDVGNSGDGLRGGGERNGPYLSGTANPYEVFRAHVDSPEVFQGGVWTDGGKHYGHLEVNIATNAQGVWECTLTPKYVFVNSSSGPFDLRAFNDQAVRRDPQNRGRSHVISIR